MRILFIADPLEHLKCHKDTTIVMIQEAASRGHELSFAQTHHLSVENGCVLVDASNLRLTSPYRGAHSAWFTLSDVRRQPLRSFSATVMRKDPPFDLEYLYTSQVFSLAEEQGAKVFSSGQALRDCNEKLAILQFPDLAPPSLITSQTSRLRAFVDHHQDVILKPLDSMGGDSIFRLSPSDANLSVIIENMTFRGKRTLIAQRYIPEICDGDKRILLIDGLPVEWCLARIPAAGETRGNLAAGGRGVARPLTKHDRAIAKKVGPELSKRGILLAGLDVIGNYLTEVNVTSPTCFREIMDQTEINVAGLYIDALERRCRLF